MNGLLDPKTFGRSIADRVWSKNPDYRDRPFRFTVDQMLSIFRREGGSNDRKFATSAARHANLAWSEKWKNVSRVIDLGTSSRK